MRVVVVGAYGLIGAAVTGRLLAGGHEVVGVGRDVAAAQRRWPAVRWVRGDLRTMTGGDWTAALAGAEAIVNCAGALQSGARDDVRAAHEGAVEAMIEGCAAAGVRRFVQISAAGVETGAGAFARTKRAGEAALIGSDLDWVILRPALVLGAAAYGGSALLRALAAFPLVIPALSPGAPVGTVAADDVAEAVVRAMDPRRPARFVCDLAADGATTLADILRALRGWLGLAPAPVVAMPGWLAALGAAAADGLGWLGWRSPMRSASLIQLRAGVEGRAADAVEHLGFTPRPLAAALSALPCGVQERWFARLYLMKPLMIATLAAFWAVSGALGAVSHAAAARLLTNGGMDARLAGVFVWGGCAADLTLAAAVCVRASARAALAGMIGLTGAYLAGACLWTPGLWLDPLGPLVKSVPAAMLALATLALMDER